MMIDFILIFPPSLSFFPARNNAKSVGNPTHTREGGWLTALVQKSRERLACSLPSHQFIASPLLFDRKLSLPDEGYGRAALPLLPPLPRKSRRGELFLEGRNAASSKRIPQLHEHEIGRRKRKLEESRLQPSAFERGGNSIGESLSIGCFLTTTLSTPHFPPLLVFQTKQIEWNDHAKILPSYSSL